MSKDKKSMDEVLASIRRIIRTDPTVAAPDASTRPPGMPAGDETAREVLEKLRRQGEGGGELTGKPLSTSDDPEESARAVLDHLRRQAEAEARQELARPPSEVPAEAEETPPEVEETLEEPPRVAEDRESVPVMEEKAADDDGTEPPGQQEKPLELGEEAGRRVMQPQKSPPPDPELPQPRRAPARPEHDGPVMIDEAALEAMIRRVVRDELMGEMGRRVTQNVVKLVRDEIARSRREEK